MHRRGQVLRRLRERHGWPCLFFPPQHTLTTCENSSISFQRTNQCHHTAPSVCCTRRRCRHPAMVNGTLSPAQAAPLVTRVHSQPQCPALWTCGACWIRVCCARPRSQPHRLTEMSTTIHVRASVHQASRAVLLLLLCGQDFMQSLRPFGHEAVVTAPGAAHPPVRTWRRCA